MRNRRTQWIIILASFFAVNGVLATVFLSQLKDSKNESAVTVLGISASGSSATDVAAVTTTSPSPEEDGDAAASDEPADGDDAAAEAPSPTTTAPSIDRLVPEPEAVTDAGTDAAPPAEDELDPATETPPSSMAVDDEPIGDDASLSSEPTPDDGTATPEADDAETETPAKSDGTDVDVEGQTDDDAPRPVDQLEAGDEVSEADGDAADSDPIVEPETEESEEPVMSTFASAETPGEGTPVAHAEVSQIAARQGPSADSAIVETFSNPTPRGGELVFQATGLSSTTGTVGVDQEEWIEVLLPVRPNGTKGWIKRSQVRITVNPYRIEVDLSRHELVVYRYGEQRLSTAIGVGTGATPTPIGGFYLTELLRPSNPNGAYGPYAYGLSGYSDTLTSFNGGPGVIGIHGTNKPSALGGDVSHGCIRVANPVITKMAEFLPLGTPVKIAS